MRRLALLVCVFGACSSPSPAPAHTPASEPVTRPAPTRPDECTSIADEEACNQARPRCHPEYGWPLECRGNHCAASTTFGFESCHAGANASCAKPATACDAPDPPCAAQGAYRVLWVGGCHEGCVRADDCAPTR